MDLVVPDHLAYCFAAGRPIFLDTVRARYFTIHETLGEAFSAVVRDGAGAGRPDQVETLIRRGLLKPNGRRAPRLSVVPARRELAPAPRGGSSLNDAIGAASAIWSTSRRLRREPFAKILSQLQADQEALPRSEADRVLVLAGRFLRHRALVPVRSVCLLDSLALRRFMRRRGGHADLVFGVIASPFAAHCWLQCEDLVLNDRLERIEAFTPILVL